MNKIFLLVLFLMLGGSMVGYAEDTAKLEAELKEARAQIEALKN